MKVVSIVSETSLISLHILKRWHMLHEAWRNTPWSDFHPLREEAEISMKWEKIVILQQLKNVCQSVIFIKDKGLYLVAKRCFFRSGRNTTNIPVPHHQCLRKQFLKPPKHVLRLTYSQVDLLHPGHLRNKCQWSIGWTDGSGRLRPTACGAVSK